MATKKTDDEIRELICDNRKIIELAKEDGLTFTEACRELDFDFALKRGHIARYGLDPNNPAPFKGALPIPLSKKNTTSATNTDGDVPETSNTLATKQLNHIIQNNKIASIFDEAKEKFNNKKFDREKLMAQMLHIAMQIAVCDELAGGGNDEKYN